MEYMETSCKYKSSHLLSKCFLITAILSLLIVGTVQAQANWPQVVNSKDGTPISYEVHGSGEPTLVFVHGWCCDSRYWRAQVPYFSKKHRVVTIDLAGHGHSGATREEYTMQAFGEDVKAVVDAVGSRYVILIGHSMGGTVIAHASLLMPERVKVIIGVDTLQNVEYPMTREYLDKMTAPLKEDFKKGCRGFVEDMFRPDTDPEIREWILTDMPAAPAHVALSALNHLMEPYVTGDAAKVFDELRLLVFVINADLWPTDSEANKDHMYSFTAFIMKDADHFLMMNKPDEFNAELDKVLKVIDEKFGNQRGGRKMYHIRKSRG